MVMRGAGGHHLVAALLAVEGILTKVDVALTSSAGDVELGSAVGVRGAVGRRYLPEGDRGSLFGKRLRPRVKEVECRGRAGGGAECEQRSLGLKTGQTKLYRVSLITVTLQVRD